MSENFWIAVFGGSGSLVALGSLAVKVLELRANRPKKEEVKGEKGEKGESAESPKESRAELDLETALRPDLVRAVSKLQRENTELRAKEKAWWGEKERLLGQLSKCHEKLEKKSARHPSAPHSPESHDHEPDQPAHILLVDDTPDTVRSLAMVLTVGEAQPHQVESAYDGKTALKMIERARLDGNPYDLVVLDVAMPHLSGEEVALLIRHDEVERGEARPIRIAFFTAQMQFLTPGLAERVGAVGVWPKLLAALEIRTRVREVLRN